MRKQLIPIRLMVFVLIFCCLIPRAAAEQITEPTQYVVTDGPSAQSDLAFGSVCLLNGCRTVDGFVPLGGSDRRLDTAQAAFAFERSTGTVVYSYNPDTRVSPGGLTKIVTAMVALQYSSVDDVVTVSSTNISRLPGGTQNVNLKHDEQLTMGDLLHCLIMQGANDAAIAIAEHVAGNQQAFVTMMNQWARQAGCTATEFGNVHGLDNTTQYTTARDMVRIVTEAIRNDTFVEIFKETSYTVPATNRSDERTFQSQDYFVDSRNIQKFYDARVTGGMQSASTAAGANVVFTAQQKNMDMIFVVMGCTRQMYDNGWQVKVYGNFEEGQTLMNFVFNNFKVNRILYSGQSLKQFSVKNGDCDVVVEPYLDLDSVLPNDVHMDNLIMDYKDRGLTAPISKGDVVATVEVWYRNTCLHEAELYAMEDVRTTSGSGLEVLGGADRSNADSRLARYVLIICVVVLTAVGGYLGINWLLRMRRRAIVRRRRGKSRRRYY